MPFVAAHFMQAQLPVPLQLTDIPMPTHIIIHIIGARVDITHIHHAGFINLKITSPVLQPAMVLPLAGFEWSPGIQ